MQLFQTVDFLGCASALSVSGWAACGLFGHVGYTEVIPLGPVYRPTLLDRRRP